jgi:hypothetical protein
MDKTSISSLYKFINPLLLLSSYSQTLPKPHPAVLQFMFVASL